MEPRAHPPQPAATHVERVALEDEEAMRRFLASNPRVLILFWATDCPFSRSFEPRFTQAVRDAQEAGWTCLVRAVEHAGEGPHGERHAIEVTPTVVAYRDGKPAERLEAKVMVGLRERSYRAWLAGLSK